MTHKSKDFGLNGEPKITREEKHWKFSILNQLFIQSMKICSHNKGRHTITNNQPSILPSKTIVGRITTITTKVPTTNPSIAPFARYQDIPSKNARKEKGHKTIMAIITIIAIMAETKQKTFEITHILANFVVRTNRK